MKRSWGSFLVILISSFMQAAEFDNYNVLSPQKEFINNIEKINTLSVLVEMIERVDACQHQDYNKQLELQKQLSEYHQEFVHIQDAENFDSRKFIDEFIQNPEDEYYKQPSRLSQSIQQLTFELMRARSACKRDPHSWQWHQTMLTIEQQLGSAMLSGGMDHINYEHAMIKHQKLLSLRDMQESKHTELSNLVHRINTLHLGSQRLLQKKHEHLSAIIIQSCAKKFLDRSRFHRQSFVVSNSITDTLLQEMMHDLVSKQIQVAQQEKNKRLYESMLTKESNKIVDQAVQFALIELQEEANLDYEIARHEREKSKAKLKKARQKENKNKSKEVAKEEEQLMLDLVQENELQRKAQCRNQYYQTLVKLDSTCQSNIPLAMLGYDIRYLELFDEHGDIKNEQEIGKFLELFEEFLLFPFEEDTELWIDVLKIIHKLHKKLQEKNKFLYSYMNDSNRFEKLLCCKEVQVASFLKKSKEQKPKDDIATIIIEKSKLQMMVKELTARSHRLDNLVIAPGSTKLKNAYSQRIYEYNQQVLSLNKRASLHTLQCEQFKIIDHIRNLQVADGPFPLFKEALPCVQAIGLLTIHDLEESSNLMKQELQYWLRYDSALTVEDMQRSLFKLLKQLPLSDKSVDEISNLLSRETIYFFQMKYSASLELQQQYFERFCKINKVYGMGLDINVVADICKIQQLLLECYTTYHSQRLK